MPNGTCSVEGCEKPIKSVKLCIAHYTRLLRNGEVGPAKLQTKGAPKPACLIDGCDRTAESRGWCSLHYWRFRKHGDPLAVRTDRNGSNNNFWQGDAIGHGGAHDRVKALHGSASGHRCRHCGGQAKHWAYDHLDPQEKHAEGYGPYSTKPEHYLPLCVPCHKRYDLGIRNGRHASVG